MPGNYVSTANKRRRCMTSHTRRMCWHVCAHESLPHRRFMCSGLRASIRSARAIRRPVRIMKNYAARSHNRRRWWSKFHVSRIRRISPLLSSRVNHARRARTTTKRYNVTINYDSIMWNVQFSIMFTQVSVHARLLLLILLLLFMRRGKRVAKRARKRIALYDTYFKHSRAEIQSFRRCSLESALCNGEARRGEREQTQ